MVIQALEILYSKDNFNIESNPRIRLFKITMLTSDGLQIMKSKNLVKSTEGSACT